MYTIIQRIKFLRVIFDFNPQKTFCSSLEALQKVSQYFLNTKTGWEMTSRLISWFLSQL